MTDLPPADVYACSAGCYALAPSTLPPAYAACPICHRPWVVLTDQQVESRRRAWEAQEKANRKRKTTAEAA